MVRTDYHERDSGNYATPVLVSAGQVRVINAVGVDRFHAGRPCQARLDLFRALVTKQVQGRDLTGTSASPPEKLKEHVVCGVPRAQHILDDW